MSQARIEEINARIEEMNNTLEGCDWCCGGGDEEMEDLQLELAGLVVDKVFDPQIEALRQSKEVTDGSLDHLIYDEKSPRP